MFPKKEVVAMLLAGGQGSRLGVLTKKLAKPAVPFGGKYRIIDFPLSNCVNSGIDAVGILTQYQPLVLNEYIGNGQPWDLDSMHSGVNCLSLIRLLTVQTGIREQPMQFIRISTTLSVIILNMLSSFRATISTKWTTTRCLNIIRKRMPLVQLR